MEYQPSNRNFAFGNTFIMTFSRIPNVEYFLQQPDIPGLVNEPVTMHPIRKAIPQPGTKVVYQDAVINFIIDEDFRTYFEIRDWIVGTGNPGSPEERKTYEDSLASIEPSRTRSFFRTSEGDLMETPIVDKAEATIIILNNTNKEVARYNFVEIFPVELSRIAFFAGDDNLTYLKASARFVYTIATYERPRA